MYFQDSIVKRFLEQVEKESYMYQIYRSAYQTKAYKERNLRKQIGLMCNYFLCQHGLKPIF